MAMDRWLCRPYTEKLLGEGKSGEWCEMKRTGTDRKKEIGGNWGSDGKFCSWGSETERQGQKHNNGGKLREKREIERKKMTEKDNGTERCQEEEIII